MVKIYHSFVLIAALHASEDGEAMLQVGKHTPALAQTDSTVRASRHQQALQMESNFEKLAAQAVRTGVTPSLGADARSAVNSALDTLEDELFKEKIANDAEMVGANAQCANCNKAQQDAFNREGVGVNAMRSVVQEARRQHAECRGTEDPNCGDEKTKCVDRNNYARQAHGAGPQCPCNEDDTADTVKDCLQKALDWGTEYNTVLGDKISACDKAKEVAKNVAEVCDHDQVNFEMAFCSYKVSLTTTCQSHTACYEAAVRNRGIVVTNLKAKEASEKIMWKSCKKVRCYLGMLNATQVSQDGFKACKEQETNTTHLDVIYPAAPAMEDCDTTPVRTLPGDAAWLEAEYARLAPNKSWLPTRRGIENITSCPRLEVGNNATAGLTAEAWCRLRGNCKATILKSGFNTLSAAQAACLADSRCEAVYDNSDGFQLRTRQCASWASESQSCGAISVVDPRFCNIAQGGITYFKPAADVKCEAPSDATTTARRSLQAGNGSSAGNNGYVTTGASAGNGSSDSNHGYTTTGASTGNGSSAGYMASLRDEISAGYTTTGASAGNGSSVSNHGYTTTGASAGNGSSVSNHGYTTTGASAGNGSSAGYMTTGASAGNGSSDSNHGYTTTGASGGNGSSAGDNGYMTTAARRSLPAHLKAQIEALKDGNNGSSAVVESTGCFDTRASGSGLHGDDTRGNYINGTSSQCQYYKNKDECELWGEGCEKTCGICA